MLWRLHGLAAFIGVIPALATVNSGIIQVTSIRSWSHSESTRVIVQTSGPFEYVQSPDHSHIDILHSRPFIAGRRAAVHAVGDHLVQRVRVAELNARTTRISFDLNAPADVSITRLDTPYRMVIELHPIRKTAAVYTAKLSPEPYRREFVYPVAPRRAQIYIPPAPSLPVNSSGYSPLPSSSLPTASNAGQFKAQKQLIVRTTTPTAAPLPSENANRSLTRALGLKVNRIVIDAGHGGHDDGTIGPHGVLEKDVVLDVSLRLARLIQERMAAEVVLTRADDQFIPLRERTQIANDHKADLFLSIHANSSPAPDVAGTETFYLNFTSSPGAIDVAARENAGSDRTLGDLKDLIQSITLNDKIEESKTLAQDIENSIQAQASRSNVNAKDRGVKRAPFVVLIGASMPSILAEIGFLSNSREEANLGKAEYRQKVAEALYKGVAKYSQSLSHYELTKAAGLDQP